MDNIPHLAMHFLNMETKTALLNVLNGSLLTGNIPNDWRHGIVTPLLKSNLNKQDINSYRPISKTSTISKIMEKVIVLRLTWFMEKN